MAAVLLSTLQQMVGFLVFFFVGILLGKRSVVPKDASAVLAKIVTFVFLPAMEFSTFAQQLTTQTIGKYALLLLAGAAFCLLSIPVSLLMQRLLKGDAVEKRTAAYSMVVPNFGYLGYPLVLALFGQETLAQFMAFTLPFNFYIYGFAMPQWMPKTGNNGLGARLKRMLSAPMIALLLGVAFGLSGLKLPTAATDVLSSASACVGPCAMLLAGLSVAKRPLRRTLSNGRAYGISAIRLLVLPALVTALLLGLRQLLPLDRALFLIPCIYAALPLGLNPVVFAETYGGDGSFGADCGLISMVLALATLPCALYLVMLLA